MLYRKMPKSGDELSILGFGCMRLPTRFGRIDEPRAMKQVLRSIDRGVNYIDTAVPYHGGASEPFVGKVLTNGVRDKVRVATKLPPWDVKRHEDMDAILLTQLDKLKTDRIDYYLLHALNRKVFNKLIRLRVFEFLDKAKADGRILNAGFSFHGTADVFPTIIDSYDWDFCQIQYNYLDETSQAGTAGLEYAASKEVGVIVMEPLRGGDLSVKIPQRVEELWKQAGVTRSPAEWALRWVWNNPNVVTVLSGMNEEEHIEENLRIAGKAESDSLTAKELDLIGQVRDVYHELKKTGCTGCCYCMPCPEGVDIPRCFEIFDDVFLFPENRWLGFRYPLQLGGFSGAEPSDASRCTRCLKCTKKCPQDLPIPDLLEATHARLHKRWMPPLFWVVGKLMGMQRKKSLKKAEELRKG